MAILIAAEEAQAADVAQSSSSATSAPSSHWSPGPSTLLMWRLRGLELALNAAMLLGDWQELTLVHFSAQFERFLWDRGCA